MFYPGSSVGTVEVFSLNTNNSTWELKGQPLYGQNKYNDSSTTDINDDGTIIVIGERNYNTLSDANDPFTYVTNGEGRVRVFYYNTNTSTWDLIGTPIIGINEQDRFGKSVSINKNCISSNFSTISIIAGAMNAEPSGDSNLNYGEFFNIIQ